MGKKQNDRKKGLEFMGEVRKILERDGCEVEGPAFKSKFIFIPDSKRSFSKNVHVDYFGCFDLISYRPDMGFVFHQVSILEEKSRKIDDLIQANKPGWIWGRFKEGSKVAYRIFSVRDETVIEREEVVLLTIPKNKRVGDFGLAGAQRKLEITLFEKGAEQWNSSST